MESVEKSQLQNTVIEGVKTSTDCKENVNNDTTPNDSEVCHKPNGVAEAINVEDKAGNCSSDVVETEVINCADTDKDTTEKSISEVDVKEPIISSNSPKSNVETVEVSTDATMVEVVQKIEEVCEETYEVPTTCTTETLKEEKDEVIETVVEVEFVEPLIPVTFETEIVVENNDNDLNEKGNEIAIIGNHSNDLINELGESIELSEALRSSDTTDIIENNNCAVKQEMFNKEELLDILEGNDVESESEKDVAELGRPESQISETQLALQQLSRLKRSRKPKTVDRQPKRRKSDKKIVKIKKETEEKKEECIVKALVKDWDDEEAVENADTEKILKEGESLINSSVDLVQVQQGLAKEDNVLVETAVDSPTCEGQSANLTRRGDEAIPQRRLARIIKKKVIFDPDNPDTFTKGKIIAKQKEVDPEKDSNVLYDKNKSDIPFQMSKTKSPISKLQWKKPPPKNSKQYRRLTEVDKLLMDEGAVNMIYQLTPEAPKGKKNMKTKAEFIKKIQSSSTPDSKEMKFRERKKEGKGEENEAKRILSGKKRSSLSSSVKSPSACEDFEAHSADDSIIYRRHSSSSYSSSCMSPRRLSDVEVGAGSSAPSDSLQTSEPLQMKDIIDTNEPPPEVFMGDNKNAPNEIINKDDCLSIKEKLNSKLSLALNKRKRDSHKIDKPHKQKKLVKTDDKVETSEEATSYKYLTITINKKLAELCIQKTGSIFNIEIIKELEKAFLYIDEKEDVSVTLLRSECGTLCSGLDLKPLLVDDMESKASYAFAISESMRSLLCVLEQHSKLICVGVGSASCSGVGLALVSLSDVILASEQASFTLDSYNIIHSQGIAAPLLPGIATLGAHGRFPQSLLDDLVLFGCRLSASDALRNGLVNRILWPDTYLEQLRAITRDIAAQSAQNILLKKQLLNLNKTKNREAFKLSLEQERDMLVQYWTSVEGQELISAFYGTS